MFDELQDQPTWYNKSRELRKAKDVFRNNSEVVSIKKSKNFQQANKKNIRLLNLELNKFKAKINQTSNVSLQKSRVKIETTIRKSSQSPISHPAVTLVKSRNGLPPNNGFKS